MRPRMYGFICQLKACMTDISPLVVGILSLIEELAALQHSGRLPGLLKLDLSGCLLSDDVLAKVSSILNQTMHD